METSIVKTWIKAPRWYRIDKIIKRAAFMLDLDIDVDEDRGILSSTYYFTIKGETSACNKIGEYINSIIELNSEN